MLLACVKETRALERRVALSPETAKKFVALGIKVALARGANTAAGFNDRAYKESGATILADNAAVAAKADILLSVQPPEPSCVAKMKKGAALVGLLGAVGAADDAVYAKAGVSAFALERLPRITRAQAMDALSSQSNLAGYKAVLNAVAVFGRALPMMMTAAGTIAPARVFVVGAGVAGLQAIATARRLGAIVSATDVRAAAAEQVESLGASFVGGEETDSETAGGYAREQAEDERARQAERLAETLKTQDIVICTALVPGRPAPTIITKEMVQAMPAGAVILDLAAAQGGNCALTKAGKSVRAHGVLIMGPDNIVSELAHDASALYARNLFQFVSSLLVEDAKPHIKWDDEIIKAAAINAPKGDTA